MSITKVFSEGVLTATDEEGKILRLPLNPEKGAPWTDEATALAYEIPSFLKFQTAEELLALKENVTATTRISKAVFQLLFTFNEMAFIEGLTDTDAGIRRLDKLLTQDLEYVDMTLPIVADGVRYILDKMVADGDFPLTQEESDIRYSAIMAVQIPGK